MIVVDPTAVTVTASNVPENDYAEYDVATTYALNALVSWQGNNYKCAVADTLNKEPGIANEWSLVGPTNRMASFDKEVHTKTEFANEITYTLQVPGLVNSLGLLNVEAESVTVVVTDPYEGEIYRHTETMADIAVGNWQEWFFTTYSTRDSVVLLDIPSYAGVTVDITISQPTGTAKCGLCVIGSAKHIGHAQYGFNSGITDYSQKTRDEFGNVTLIEREYADRLSVSVEMPTQMHMPTKRFLASLRTKPSLYVVAENMSGTHVYGIYKDFQIVVPNGVNSICSIELEGLI